MFTFIQMPFDVFSGVVYFHNRANPFCVGLSLVSRIKPGSTLQAVRH